MAADLAARTCRVSAMPPVLLIIVILLASVATLPAATAEMPRLVHPPKADGSLTVLAVGDWGRRGAYNQSQVATQVISARARSPYTPVLAFVNSIRCSSPPSFLGADTTTCLHLHVLHFLNLTLYHMSTSFLEVAFL
jgi:hypothetical protein